jgi:hypothetical protein
MNEIDTFYDAQSIADLPDARDKIAPSETSVSQHLPENIELDVYIITSIAAASIVFNIVLFAALMAALFTR